MPPNFLLREETPEDYDAIRLVNRLAFGQDEEADIVDRLRGAGLVRVSLVAEMERRIAGHILFSELPVEVPGGAVRALALAPMAVAPGWQRQGIGSALVRRGLELCAQRRWEVVIVVGHPEYYPRFGFSAEKARSLQSPFQGEIFMALELVPGALDGIDGTVHYPAAFGL